LNFKLQWHMSQDIHLKWGVTRNVFKKDKRRQIKKGKKCLYTNLTQMTENLEWLLSRISWQLFWRTLLESKWCLQIPLRTFITCVMTDRQEKLASLILYTKHMLKSITLNGTFNSKGVALYYLDKWTPSRKHGQQQI